MSEFFTPGRQYDYCHETGFLYRTTVPSDVAYAYQLAAAELEADGVLTSHQAMRFEGGSDDIVDLWGLVPGNFDSRTSSPAPARTWFAYKSLANTSPIPVAMVTVSVEAADTTLSGLTELSLTNVFASCGESNLQACVGLLTRALRDTLISDLFKVTGVVHEKEAFVNNFLDSLGFEVAQNTLTFGGYDEAEAGVDFDLRYYPGTKSDLIDALGDVASSE